MQNKRVQRCGRASALLGVLLALLSACAPEPQAPIEISDAFMREMPPGRDVGVVYLRMKNTGANTEQLMYVSAAIAERVEVHRHLYENGMMKMRQIPHFHIDPNTQVDFSPGGYHLMLFGVDTPPSVGERFVMQLEFSDQAPIQIDVEVRKRS